MLFLCVFAGAFAIECGELNSWDAANRLQVTRWLWQDEPQVRNPQESWYGVIGRDGEKFAWTGLGQSLWMLPGHLIAAPLAGTSGHAEKLEEILVTYLVFPLTSALAVEALYGLLLALAVPARWAALGALAAFWCTSLLPYTKTNQENSLLLLCTATALWATARAVRSDGWGWWLLAGGAVGFNLLTRLTTGLDALAVGLFGLLLLCADRSGTLAGHLRRLGLRVAVAAAVVLAFVFAERAYNFHRFESWTNTYYDLQEEQKADYLYAGDFRTGFPGLMWSVESNIWQFDPLALAALVALAVLWRRLTPEQRALAASVVALLAVCVLFYATRPFYDGDHAWGSRYTTTPVILLGALGVAFTAAHAGPAQTWLRRLVVFAALAGFAVQLGSTFFWYNLEEQQQKEGLGASASMVVLRGQNVAAYFTGNWEEWGLMPDFPSERLRTPNYFPFLAAKHLPPAAKSTLFAAWILAVLGALVLNLRLLRILLRPGDNLGNETDGSGAAPCC